MSLLSSSAINCEAASLTRAPHAQRVTAITVRLSDFAGIPAVPDNSDGQDQATANAKAS
ncbi:MAG: hypothetical protein ACXVZV_04830 [Terriglobales bacterium]